jgi:uncharacterized phage protein (TIGR02216 family)
MAFGLGVLRLSPRDFWAMTPRELAAASAGFSGHAFRPDALTGAELAGLMHRYPDGG